MLALYAAESPLVAAPAAGSNLPPRFPATFKAVAATAGLLNAFAPAPTVCAASAGVKASPAMPAAVRALLRVDSGGST